MNNPDVREIWSISQLTVLLFSFCSVFLWRKVFSLPEKRAYTLSTTDQDSQKSPTSIAFNIWTSPVCLLAASQGSVDPSCLGLHLEGELWMELEPEHVTGHLQPWDKAALSCLETCFWSIADTSRHWKLFPAELIPSVNTFTRSWRGSIAEADSLASLNVLGNMCPKESLQMLIIQISMKAAGIEPEGTVASIVCPPKD